jgi:hypothetical protein
MTRYQDLFSILMRRAPKPVCDQCLADHSGLRIAQIRAARTRIRGDQGIVRYRGQCSGCCAVRAVTALVKQTQLLPSTATGGIRCEAL